MRLSIIIPTYNSAQTIRRCLDSIVSQSFADWEVLIMDGVSKDNTIELAKSYHDSRIKVYSEPDKGIYDAMNKGIKKAQGEWLYFLGSDDWLYGIETLHTIFSMDIDKYDVVYGDVCSKLDYRHCGEWSYKHIFYNRCHQAIFYKRTLFPIIGLYNIEYKVFADYAINLKWFLDQRFNHMYINVIIANFSDGGCSSHDSDHAFDTDMEILSLQYGYKVLPVQIKKELARRSIKNNPKMYIRNIALELYIYYLRVIDKLSLK